MFGRHQTATQLTRPSVGRVDRGRRSAGVGQPPVDPARLRVALAQACTIGLRERMSRAPVPSRAA